jgi:Fic family protein
MTWIWENKNWPDFTWNSEMINPLCREITFFLGTLNAKIGFAEEKEASLSELDSLLNNIVKSSSIEGESVNAFSVRSSLAKRLKINIKKFPTTDRTEGLAELQLDIFQNIDKELSLKRLFIWHHWLFPASENWKIPVGKLRGYSPMHVVSGRIDNPKIHFEAPPRKELVNEMKSMLDWFEETRNKLDFDPFIRSGIIHLWFLTIHPFEDGNGRIHRYLLHHILAEHDFTPSGMLFPISAVISKRIGEYRNVLEFYSKPRRL